MARRRKYLDISVLEAARQRIHHIYDMFDRVVVLFSGGKDSTVLLNLVWEVAQERGETHVDVVHHDQEFIQDEVVQFVYEYHDKPWVRMNYFAVPWRCSRYILGKMVMFTQWDPEREPLRPAPPYAIRSVPGVPLVESSTQMDDYVVSFYPGKVALVNGMRASESLARYRGAVNKLNDSYINSPYLQKKRCRYSMCKPLYDWKENDVFRYFWDTGIEYCKLYDAQILARAPMRVSTPFHVEAAKRLSLVKAFSPVFYEQITRMFPDALLQERYYHEVDLQSIPGRYGDTFEGVERYVAETYDDPVIRAGALEQLRKIKGKVVNRPSGYNWPALWRYVISGSITGHTDCMVPEIGRSELEASPQHIPESERRSGGR